MFVLAVFISNRYCAVYSRHFNDFPLMGSIGEWTQRKMKTKAEYLAKAKRCEERARKVRNLENRDWQLTLSRVYRNLAKAESEAVARRLSVAA